MENLIIKKQKAIMRIWQTSDADEFVTGIKSADIDQNLRPEYPRTIADFIEFVKRCRSKAVPQDFAITQEKTIKGGISFIDNGNPMIELGCLWIAEPYRNNGLAKGAIKTLIEHIIKIYPNHGIFGQVYDFNEKEISMMDKLGFKLAGCRNVPYKGTTTNLLRFEYN